MSADTVAGAIAEIILNLGITASTSLVQPANPGDTTLHVESTAGFAVGQLVPWYDGTDEEALAIAAVDATAGTITLDFTGTGYTGLQQWHEGMVCTNLLTDAPSNASPMLQLPGRPLIFIMAIADEERLFSQRATQHVYTMHVQYHRTLTSPGSAKLNTNVWARRQQRAARTDLTAISAAISANPRLVTSTGVNAVGLGKPGQPNNRMLSNWRRLATDAATQLFSVAMDITVQGTPTTF